MRDLPQESISSSYSRQIWLLAVPWTNCLAVGCDNAPVMTGSEKGVIAFVREKHPDVFMAGCCLHLVHFAAHKGAVCLSAVEDVLVDTYYYFQKSGKRQHEFAALQQMYDIDQKRMLKHVCTRWLSIGRCLGRLLHNWTALKAFFNAEKEAQEKRLPARKDDITKEKPYAQRKVESVLTFQLRCWDVHPSVLTLRWQTTTRTTVT